MNYLFIDTSNNLIISIIKNNQIIYNYTNDSIETSGIILKAIDDAFKTTSLKPIDINKIFVITGPGSFTGIRVGLDVAKIMGYLLNIPLIPLSELELMATKELFSVPIIDARRGYVYGAIYNNLKAIFPDKYILLETLKSNIPKGYTIIDNNKDCDILKLIKKHELDNPLNPHIIKPNYLKKTEAEENDQGML